MHFGLDEMLLESVFQLGIVRCFRHLRQRRDKLSFCVQQILQFFDE